MMASKHTPPAQHCEHKHSFCPFPFSALASGAVPHARTGSDQWMDCQNLKTSLANFPHPVYTEPNLTATPIPWISPWHAQPWRFFVAHCLMRSHERILLAVVPWRVS